MAQRQKMNQVMTGIGLLMLAVLAFIFTFSLALTPLQEGTAVSPILGEYHYSSLSLESPLANALLWLLMPVPALVALKGGIWRLKRGLEIRKSALAHKPQTVWASIGTFLQFRDIFNTGFFMLLFLALLALLLHFLWYGPKAISANILFYLVTIVVYFLMRKRITSFLDSVSQKILKGLPTYTLTDNGVTIKLITMSNHKQPAPPPVHISFEEIEDLQVLTYVEAESYLRYNIGPDLNIGIKQAKDYAQYVKGNITRPSVYTFGAPSSNDMNVVIRGPELFYMLVFDAVDLSDLVEAYRSYQEKMQSGNL